MVVGLAWLVLIVYHFCYHCMFIVHLEFDYHLISVLIFPSSLSYFCICTPSRKSQQDAVSQSHCRLICCSILVFVFSLCILWYIFTHSTTVPKPLLILPLGSKPEFSWDIGSSWKWTRIYLLNFSGPILTRIDWGHGYCCHSYWFLSSLKIYTSIPNPFTYFLILISRSILIVLLFTDVVIDVLLFGSAHYLVG